MNNLFGLKADDLKRIISVLTRENEVDEAIIFGSRAKGNYKPGSDLDMALKGEKLVEKNITHVSYLLNEESGMPYKFDVLNFDTLTNSDLVEHINRMGIVIYTRIQNITLPENKID